MVNLRAGKTNLSTENWNLEASSTHTKETTLERADFTLQLLMFVTAEKEGQMIIIFFLSIFCLLLSTQF